jgi:hypothetical protein
VVGRDENILPFATPQAAFTGAGATVKTTALLVPPTFRTVMERFPGTICVPDWISVDTVVLGIANVRVWPSEEGNDPSNKPFAAMELFRVVNPEPTKVTCVPTGPDEGLMVETIGATIAEFAAAQVALAPLFEPLQVHVQLPLDRSIVTAD